MGQNKKTSCDACGKYYYECIYSSNLIKLETAGSYVWVAVDTESCPRCGEVLELVHRMMDDEQEIKELLGETAYEEEQANKELSQLYLVYNNSKPSEVFLKRYAGFTFGNKKDTEGNEWDYWIEYMSEDYWANIKARNE